MTTDNLTVKSKSAYYGRPERKPRPIPNLKFFRERAGKTQADCYKHINVKQPVYWKAENTGEGFSQEKWYQLADFLECDPAELQGYKKISLELSVSTEKA